jgi:hypothetical protein
MGTSNKPKDCVHTGLNFPGFPPGYAPERIGFILKNVVRGDTWSPIRTEPFNVEAVMEWYSSTRYRWLHEDKGVNWFWNVANETYQIISSSNIGPFQFQDFDDMIERPVFFNDYDGANYPYGGGSCEILLNLKCWEHWQNYDYGDLINVPQVSKMFSQSGSVDPDVLSIRFARHFDGTNVLMKMD